MKNYRLLSASEPRLYFRHLAFYIGKDKKRVGKVPASKLLRVLCRFRLPVRLLRLEPKCVEMLGEDQVLFCVLHKVWVLNLRTGDIKVLLEVSEGVSNPINFCKGGGTDKVYWGDYGQNSLRNPVSIYSVDTSLKIEKVYTYPQGSIRHIHNIIYSPDQQCFYILTGDNDKRAGIYRSDLDFKDVQPVGIGNQNFRAVVAFPYKDGLIYATDSVETENHIFVCTQSSGYKLESLTAINGSCIYGTEIQDHFIFSTTVEPHQGEDCKFLKRWFSEELGGGIKSRDVHLIAVNKKDLSDIKIIAKYRKDCWPMRLFQYGSVHFPIGQKDKKTLRICPMACKKYDGKTIEIMVK